MANNPYVNKVVYDGNTLIDLSSDTVTSSDLVSGVTAHDRSGASITGSFDPSIYVQKAGDTMTGNLNISKDSSPELVLRNNSMDTGATSRPTVLSSRLFFTDDYNRVAGSVKVYQDTYGYIELELNSRNRVEDNGTFNDVNNKLAIGVYPSGTRTVEVSDSTIWRKAFGLGTNGDFPITIAQGGSGQTDVTSVTAVNTLISSSGTNFTVSAVNYCQWGKVAMFQITASRSTKITGGTATTICTLDTNYRPKNTAPATLRLTASDSSYFTPYTIYITANGNVTFIGKDDIPASKTMYINATYILA